MATTTTFRPALCSRRAACAEIAVLPTRLPVPTIASAGWSSGSATGGRSSKSAPSYVSPAARAFAAMRPATRIFSIVSALCTSGPV